MADLSSIPGVKADKHSTGGVGGQDQSGGLPDRRLLRVAVAKMSAGAWDIPGAPIDKLESIPGFRTELDTESFLRQVRNRPCHRGAE
jgi:thymidine phosphorylase